MVYHFYFFFIIEFLLKFLLVFDKIVRIRIITWIGLDPEHCYGANSVADPGCLCWIPEPNYNFPPLIQGRKDPQSRIRIRLKEFKYF